MTSTLCQSLSLGRIITLWVAQIAELFGIIIKTILTIVENVGDTLREPGVCCRKAGWPGLSRPMMPKHETMGRHMRLAGLRYRGAASWIIASAVALSTSPRSCLDTGERSQVSNIVKAYNKGKREAALPPRKRKVGSFIGVDCRHVRERSESFIGVDCRVCSIL